MNGLDRFHIVQSVLDWVPRLMSMRVGVKQAMDSKLLEHRAFIRAHVVIAGAVGQPRDGNPSACFVLVDTQRQEVTMVRVPYDHEETARKIQAAGLPGWLGMRLKIGR